MHHSARNSVAAFDLCYTAIVADAVRGVFGPAPGDRTQISESTARRVQPLFTKAGYSRLSFWNRAPDLNRA